jgi:two-component system, NarL family, sensor kinase
MSQKRERGTVARAVAMFALSGFVVLLLVGVAGGLVLRRLGTSEAMREADNITVVSSRVIQRRLTDGILHGDANSRAAVDSVVYGGLLRDPIVGVTIWTPQGKVVYSDQLPLIGSTYALDPNERAALADRMVVAGPADLSLPQNRFERDNGPLLAVSVPVFTPKKRELLFEAYLRSSAVLASARQLWTAFLPVLAMALIVLTLLQIPLAYRLAQRVRQSREDRERLLQRAIEASDVERRRIASDLHDGPVQQLAGLALSLSARADFLAPQDPAAAETLREAADGTRQGIRTLRSALMGIYPPTLEQAGLRSALTDLAAPLEADGVKVGVVVPGELELPRDVEALLFRAAQEATRNIVSHARADHVQMSVRGDRRRAVLEIRDDGVGFSSQQGSSARVNGHLGLRVLNDLASDAHGTLDIDSAPGHGTRVRLEVPLG